MKFKNATYRLQVVLYNILYFDVVQILLGITLRLPYLTYFLSLTDPRRRWANDKKTCANATEM